MSKFKGDDALSKELSELEIINGKVISFLCGVQDEEIDEAKQLIFNALFEDYTNKLEHIETMYGLQESVIVDFCEIDLPEDIDYQLISALLLDYTEGYIMLHLPEHYEAHEDEWNDDFHDEEDGSPYLN